MSTSNRFLRDKDSNTFIDYCTVTARNLGWQAPCHFSMFHIYFGKTIPKNIPNNGFTSVTALVKYLRSLAPLSCICITEDEEKSSELARKILKSKSVKTILSGKNSGHQTFYDVFFLRRQ